MNRLGIIQSNWIIHGWGQGMPVQGINDPTSPLPANDVPTQSAAVSATAGITSPVDGTPYGIMSFLPMSTI